MAGAHLRFCMPVAVLILGFQPAPARADMIDMTGVDPGTSAAVAMASMAPATASSFRGLRDRVRKYLAKQLSDFR